ncbi:MAG TPA: hypothetical protein VHE34_29925 [Puia sp.]|uniref:hypothetical protein n=1 Tax=Puia sp. TaxID=2045100 RepID=UPI002B5F7F4F|nr:hypothetical protein [Puia sp.]HVU99491.1 hypothetical protein [Puia sp.]
MFDCHHLDHPFLHDPGVSQADRALATLLPENLRIDGRKTADLLNYFTELARQINFYNTDSSILDWSLFFENSLPFLLSRIAVHPLKVQEQKLATYEHLLHRNASASSLQLLFFYSYYNLILPLHRWAVLLKGTNVDLETGLTKLIKENLRQPLLSFISLANTASHCYGIRKIDFADFLQVDAWGLEQADLYAYQASFVCSAGGTRPQILALWNSANDVLPFFTGVIGQASSGAANDVNDKLTDVLTLGGGQDLPPHLALLFSFINLFGKLQSDLNRFARHHLRYFYTQVLQLAPAPAVGDKAFLVFGIQQQFKQYLLDKGLLVKDGKDSNKADILFSLDKPLVVNQAQISDTRTLFFNTLYHYDQYYTEGAYMAPNALMADGLTKPFADASYVSWATLGSRLSKYMPTGDDGPIPYPAARLGLILHSPVLLLNEGTRTITIHMDCEYKDDICPNALPGELGMSELFPVVSPMLSTTYFYFTQDNVAEALGKGLAPSLGEDILTNCLTYTDPKGCYGPHSQSLYDAFVPTGSLSDPDALAVFFPKRTVFQLQFSGAKGWIQPIHPPTVTLLFTGGTGFTLDFQVTLQAEEPAVSFYDKKVFGGLDYQTTDPMVKILLDDAIKMVYTSLNADPGCCLEPKSSAELSVSTYHFFKHLLIKDLNITTEVCGMKNLIVQNDQSVMSVNGPIYPFGTRPTIIDFNLIQPQPPASPGPPTTPNLKGPNFYLGSAEIFCKSWNYLWIGINWKDKPGNFNDYYAGYLRRGDGSIGNPFVYGLNSSDFVVNLSLLSDGLWKPELVGGPFLAPSPSPDITDNIRRLFDKEDVISVTTCSNKPDYGFSFYVTPDEFLPVPLNFEAFPASLTKYTVDSRIGFLRFTLEYQDFLHKDYPFVLARQMLAANKLPDVVLDGAIFFDDTGNYFVVNTTLLYQEYLNLQAVAGSIGGEVTQIGNDAVGLSPNPIAGGIGGPADDIRQQLVSANDLPAMPPPPSPGLIKDAGDLAGAVNTGINDLKPHAKPAAVIPKEPWTPTIQDLTVNYSATATKTDIGLIHLYPFDGTYELMDVESEPGLLPVFCQEGLLFLGVQNLIAGENLNILFQLAEATADTEEPPATVQWEYLTNNAWQPLAPGFQVINDGTQNLTRTGVVELSIPKDINTTNTKMPAGLYWLRVSLLTHTAGVAETQALFTQAVGASFVPGEGDPATATAPNDLTRLSTPLAAKSLARLDTADPVVTKVQQPSPSFDGRAPEDSGNGFFIRISELLRHKSRGIQKWDYERLVLQGFPQVLRAKCINHSYFLDAHQYLYDFPIAPGNVIVAVIPDVTQLAPADSLQPRVPAAMLEKIRTLLSGIISPFIRLFIVNPRYEEIDFCLRIVLKPGYDREFYQQQVKKDLTQYLAPWTTGDMKRYVFGQPVYRSDVIRFLEGLSYIDHLLDLQMKHHEDADMPMVPAAKVEPRTPRSILVAGEIIVDVPDAVEGDQFGPKCGSLPVVIDHCGPKIAKAILTKKNGNGY